MAPIEQVAQVLMESLVCRHSIAAAAPRRSSSSDGGDGNGKQTRSEKNSRGGGNGDGDDDSGGLNSGGNGWDKGKGNGIGKDKKQDNGEDAPTKPQSSVAKSSISPPPPPQPIITPIPAAPSSVAPTTIIITMTMPASTVTPTPITFPTPTTKPLTVPITTPIPTTSAPPDAATSIQGRKGVNSYKNSSRISQSTSYIATMTVIIPESPSIPTSTRLPDHSPNPKHDDNLFTSAELVLIGVGATGGFIIVMAILYRLTRWKKFDAFSKVRNRQLRKGGNHGFYGWRRDSHTSEAPPEYDEYYRYSQNENKYHPERESDGAYAPVTLPPLSIPPQTVGLSRGEPQRRPGDTTRSPLLEDAASFAYSPQVISPSNSQLPNIGTGSNRLPHQVYDVNNNNNTTVTQSTNHTWQASNLGHANQKQLNHMSYMSSLSSGFGDGLVPLEPSLDSRGSRAVGEPRFSWMRKQTPGDRDTVYTTTSEAPRFRSVNSWVAQQAGRSEGTVDQKAPSVPTVPIQHQRNISEDPVFKFHPGQEVQISRGSRVPSEILNAKTGIDK